MLREKWLQRLASLSTRDLVQIVKDYDQCHGCTHDANSALRDSHKIASEVAREMIEKRKGG